MGRTRRRRYFEILIFDTEALRTKFTGNPGADGFPGRSGLRGPKGAPGDYGFDGLAGVAGEPGFRFV